MMSRITGLVVTDDGYLWVMFQGSVYQGTRRYILNKLKSLTKEEREEICGRY